MTAPLEWKADEAGLQAKCPHCGKFSLVRGDVNTAGVVSPSFQCSTCAALEKLPVLRMWPGWEARGGDLQP